MAFALLDGTSGNIDATIATVSVKGIFGYLSCDFDASFFQMNTFNTGTWEDNHKGFKRWSGRLGNGFMSSGNAQSDPLANFASATALALVATFQTGCTVSGSVHFSHDHEGVSTMAASERDANFIGTGTPTTAWVVS